MIHTYYFKEQPIETSRLKASSKKKRESKGHNKSQGKKGSVDILVIESEEGKATPTNSSKPAPTVEEPETSVAEPTQHEAEALLMSSSKPAPTLEDPENSGEEKDGPVTMIETSAAEPTQHEAEELIMNSSKAEPSQQEAGALPEIKSEPITSLESKEEEALITEEPQAVLEDSTSAKEGLPSAESAAEGLDETLLMDESIISIADSPPVAPEQRPRDSTFSPIVDTLIHDSRPVIDFTVPLRSSTPVGQRVRRFVAGETPKLSLHGISSLAQGLTSHKTAIVKSAEPDENFRAQLKSANPLEKSILKSSRRKRSFSVTEAESFMQKRVMFISPQVMEIGAIDEKMMASFMEEQENSMMRQAAGSSRRKRSLSTGTPLKVQPIGTPGKNKKVVPRIKMPNFSAIHERQFEKMESIQDYNQRKVERFKKLVTPVRDMQSKASKSDVGSKIPQLNAFKLDIQTNGLKSHAASKIPTMNARKPLAKVPSTENVSQITRRVLKRSLSTSDEPLKKTAVVPLAAGPSTSNFKKVAVVNALQRAKSEDQKTTSTLAPSVSAFSSIGIRNNEGGSSSSQSIVQKARSKVEERRERNMGLYKTNHLQRSVSDTRIRNANLLKGVRLNRRFELQMQHRRDQDESKDEA